jgi:Uma2 family endonuclease
VPVRYEEPLRRVRMSWEEFLRLPEWPRAEWVDGEVVMLTAPPVFDHGTAQTELIRLLGPLFPGDYLVPRSSSSCRATG